MDKSCERARAHDEKNKNRDHQRTTAPNPTLHLHSCMRAACRSPQATTYSTHAVPARRVVVSGCRLARRSLAPLPPPASLRRLLVCVVKSSGSRGGIMPVRQPAATMICGHPRMAAVSPTASARPRACVCWSGPGLSFVSPACVCVHHPFRPASPGPGGRLGRVYQYHCEHYSSCALVCLSSRTCTIVE